MLMQFFDSLMNKLLNLIICLSNTASFNISILCMSLGWCTYGPLNWCYKPQTLWLLTLFVICFIYLVWHNISKKFKGSQWSNFKSTPMNNWFVCFDRFCQIKSNVDYFIPQLYFSIAILLTPRIILCFHFDMPIWWGV
jgi:hypothetical protein